MLRITPSKNSENAIAYFRESLTNEGGYYLNDKIKYSLLFIILPTYSVLNQNFRSVHGYLTEFDSFG